MGYIHRPSKSGSGVSDTGAFIQCVNGREPQNHEFLCWDIDEMFHEVHLIAHVEILAGTFREFLTYYLSENGRRHQIIGGLIINGSVQFIGLSQIRGSRFPYMANL